MVAAASPSATATADGVQGVPRLVFPLVASTELWDNYGDSRGTHSHAGIDMENPWRAPVVAVEAGKVKYWDSGLGGCMLYLYGKSGTMYMYIHLNNDLTPKNDNRGGCVEDVAFAVPNGASVSAGEQIAWNGDSGDAAGNPHLHFEVHPNGGADANPFRHLKRAVKPLFAAKLGSPFSLGLRGKLLASGEGSGAARGRPCAALSGRPLARRRRTRASSSSSRRAPRSVGIGDVAATRRILDVPASVTAYTREGEDDRGRDRRRPRLAQGEPRLTALRARRCTLRAWPRPRPRPFPRTRRAVLGARVAEATVVVGVLGIVRRRMSRRRSTDRMLEKHAFRQTQTAYTARVFHEDGIDLLHPKLPVLGEPFEVPFEFPLFQAAASLVDGRGRRGRHRDARDRASRASC